MPAETQPTRPRRQLGADRPRDPLPMIAPPASDRAITLGRLAIVVTITGWLSYVITTVVRQIVDHGIGNMRFASETFSYVLVVSFLSFSALMYLVARQGSLYRSRSHARVPRAELDSWFDTTLPTMTVLVPSYREDPRVVRMTLLSAALQEYPFMRIVLLVDDPPRPTDPEHVASLQAARDLPGEVERMLREPRERMQRLLERFEAGSVDDGEPSAAELRRLAGEYRWAAGWLHGTADAELVTDHVDTFFVEQCLRGLAGDLALVGDAIAQAAKDGATLPRNRVGQLYRRLAWTFRAELSSFERKQFASLSNEPNKAMNLNAYIGLMGQTYDEVETPRGRLLVPAGSHGSLVVPDTDYLLTLDADSVLLREYCLRLVHLLEQPHNAQVAVTQTPYSAFPGSTTRLERLAGATTDLQHILHQGMSYYGATFWVGANAVLRKSALEDIVEVTHENGIEVRRYVQDRTVIEDTESSIDLGVHGWTLVNYPERLSYSATPPDFGSLVVQRRRWADGGLLIMPKLLRHWRERRRRFQPGGATEMMLRTNYMASIAWASFGLVFLLAYPYDSRLLSPLVVLTALPYFLAMSSDLKRLGYKRLDVFRIYGFNLILLPVNLAGVIKSLQQALTGKKIPFARTPKVKDRTATPITYVLAPVLLVLFSIFTLWRGTIHGNWGNAAFAGFNAVLAAYAIVAFIGVRNAVVDVVVNAANWLYVDDDRVQPVRRARPSTKTAEPPAPLSWEQVLYHGGADTASRPSAPVPIVRSTTGRVSEPDPATTPVPLPGEPSPVAAKAFSDLVAALGDEGDVELRLDSGEIAVTWRRSRAAEPATEPAPATASESSAG